MEHKPKPPAPTATGESNPPEEGDAETSGSAPVNLQQRRYDLDPTRYADWELNGRCIDF